MSDDLEKRGEPFLARWSRRKQAEPEIRQREDLRVDEDLAQGHGEPATPAGPAPQEPLDPPADLPSIESLTPDSDYGRFMRPDVPAASRNAAMKKLFADPLFNVMDGLDIYIDDYTKPDPIPLAMLKDLAQSRMLRLFDQDKEPAPAAPDASTAQEAAAVAAPPPQDCLEQSESTASPHEPATHGDRVPGEPPRA